MKPVPPLVPDPPVVPVPPVAPVPPETPVPPDAPVKPLGPVLPVPPVGPLGPLEPVPPVHDKLLLASPCAQLQAQHAQHVKDISDRFNHRGVALNAHTQEVQGATSGTKCSAWCGPVSGKPDVQV